MQSKSEALSPRPTSPHADAAEQGLVIIASSVRFSDTAQTKNEAAEMQLLLLLLLLQQHPQELASKQ